ncbi:MAG: putative lipid II flippase FtsW [Firmicutes bacterium]|nr:putative lipid II flippase FtsW [Bacillota bacterium]
MSELERKKTKLTPDWWLLAGVLLLTAIGVIMVFSSSQYFASYAPYNDSYAFLKKQLINVAIGLVVLAAAYKVKLSWYKKLSYPAFIVLLGLLAFMLLYTGLTAAGGAERWVEIAGINFQPSELAKIILPMAIARWMWQHQDRLRTFKWGFAPTICAIAVVSVMILGESDLSSAVVVAGTGFLMMYCGGIRPIYLGGTIALGLVGVIGAIIIEPYRMERVYAWLNPWNYRGDEGWQTCQSLMALGSGGLTGVGLGNGGSKWFYLPERHTDFIFSIIGEELGLLGAVFVVLLIAFIVWRGILIAVKAPDMYTSLLAFGLIGCIGLQSLVNLGVVTGLLPVTGVTLPFVSYGGTSMVVSMGIIGMLLNISCYARK